MTDLRKAAEMALEALETRCTLQDRGMAVPKVGNAIEALRTALAQPEQGEVVVTKLDGQIVAVTRQDEDGKVLKVIAESAQPEQKPVREHDKVDLRCECCGYMTYHREHLGCIRAAAPPKREFVGLTDEARVECYETSGHRQTLRPQDRYAILEFSMAIESQLKEKNT